MYNHLEFKSSQGGENIPQDKGVHVILFEIDCAIFYTNLKFMLSKKTTKIEEIFTVDLTLCSKCQIEGEDFVIFCSLLGKHEL